MDKAKNKIAPLNMNKILTFYAIKLTHPIKKSNRNKTRFELLISSYEVPCPVPAPQNCPQTLTPLI
jgi:hypothetical protein